MTPKRTTNVVKISETQINMHKKIKTSLPNSSELLQPTVCSASFFGRRGHFPIFQVLQHRQEVLIFIPIKKSCQAIFFRAQFADICSTAQ
jgi:hypothetical protein